ncbi:MAG: amidohydrolase [bacterium]|nr:amidohydrolase [bacterium]
MKITLIQSDLKWEDPQGNLSHFDSLINSLEEKSDLIVLPEMFSTGFTMNPQKFAEDQPGESLNWLRKKSDETQTPITGSVSVKEGENYYNRLYWMKPDRTFEHYDKRHLFRMAKEDQHYASGTKKIITKIEDWKICPLVCYDLRFPVWSRNKYDAKKNEWTYDVLIYVANWPEVRSYAWKHLLIARAIENQCYVIGVNRVGKDGNGFDHSGDSVVINPRGEIISALERNKEQVSTIDLDRSYLDDFRKLFPVGLDADGFELES